MRKAVWAALLIVLIQAQPSSAQDGSGEDRKAAQQLLSALRKLDKAAIAKLVRYPITRREPLSRIRNEKEFVENFEDFFDSKTIPEVLSAEKNIWSSWRGTAIGEGLLWIDSGKIFSINLSTAQQKQKAEKEKARIVATLHPSARRYDSVAFICNTKNYHVRVHDDKGTLRYYSWKAGQPLSSKPDLMLTGKVAPEGNGGNATFTFKNGAYSYLIDKTVICGPDCHSYLMVKRGESNLLREPCDDESLIR